METLGKSSARIRSRTSCRAAMFDSVILRSPTSFKSNNVRPFRKSSRKITRSENPGIRRKPIRFESSSSAVPTLRLFRALSVDILLRSTTQSTGFNPACDRSWRALQTISEYIDGPSTLPVAGSSRASRSKSTSESFMGVIRVSATACAICA